MKRMIAINIIILFLISVSSVFGSTNTFDINLNDPGLNPKNKFVLIVMYPFMKLFNDMGISFGFVPVILLIIFFLVGSLIPLIRETWRINKKKRNMFISIKEAFSNEIDNPLMFFVMLFMIIFGIIVAMTHQHRAFG